MGNVRIIRSKNVPTMVQKEGDGKYYPKTCNGVTLVLPSEAYIIAKDLLDYCMKYTDIDIEQWNKNALDNEFRR